MLFVLSNHQTLYAALLARCPDYEGRAYVGVASTGIFLPPYLWGAQTKAGKLSVF